MDLYLDDLRKNVMQYEQDRYLPWLEEFNKEVIAASKQGKTSHQGNGLIPKDEYSPSDCVKIEAYLERKGFYVNEVRDNATYHPEDSKLLKLYIGISWEG